jgi:hypothetical protein
LQVGLGDGVVFLTRIRVDQRVVLRHFVIARLGHFVFLLVTVFFFARDHTGGENYTDGYLGTAELYNAGTGKWTLTGSMTVPRVSHSAVLLQNGQVLVAGGYNSGPILASAELYNPSTGAWTPTGSMTTARASFVMALLSNGKVLAAGGDGFLTSAELYDPATRTWTATGSMTTGNDTNWAVLLQNGEVFVLNDDLYNPSTMCISASPDPAFLVLNQRNTASAEAFVLIQSIYQQ